MHRYLSINCAQYVRESWDNSVCSYTHIPHPDLTNTSHTANQWGEVQNYTHATPTYITTLPTVEKYVFNLFLSLFSPLSTQPTTTTTIYISNKKGN